MSEIVETNTGEVRALTVDELDEVSGGVSPLTLAIDLVIIRLASSLF
jgi:lactobin A/cerein 7B family class IIb bacteriocin